MVVSSVQRAAGIFQAHFELIKRVWKAYLKHHWPKPLETTSSSLKSQYLIQVISNRIYIYALQAHQTVTVARMESINLHPATHELSSLKTQTYDIIGIGSGWATRVAGARAVKAGLTALIVESELVGGECPFWACIPSKALLRPQEVLGEALAVTGVKELLPPDAKVDAAAVLRRRDKYTAGWDDGVHLIPMVEGAGVDLVRGYGKIAGEKQVEVRSADGQVATLHARHAVIIGSGSVAVIPSIPGLAEAKPWTPRHATSSDHVPKSLVVIGTGAVGMEMATVYASLGSRVTLVARSPEILPNYDAEIGKTVREAMVSRGATVLVATSVTKVTTNADGQKEVHLDDGQVIQTEEILVATGRRPATDGLGLEQYGIPVDGTPIKVDDSLCISAVPGGWLYGAGDVVGRGSFSHSSKYHGRIISNSIVAKVRGTEADTAPWGSASATADAFAVPQVVFTSPVVASVGLSAKGAQDAGIAHRVVRAPLATSGTMVRGETPNNGFAQWVVDSSTNRLLGAVFVGNGVEELLHPSTVAIVGQVPLERLAHAVACFPTMSEVYLNLLDAAGL